MELRDFVNKASGSSVISGLEKIKTDYLPNDEFLNRANPLGIDAITAIKNHFKINNAVLFSSEDAKTYLAVSSLVHCIDGWNYLSNSINALLSGDGYISIHLSYYSELRAAMSFLSSEGIGVFKNKHFCVDNSNVIYGSPKQNTHEFIWKVLGDWHGDFTKGNNLLKLFSHNGKTFTDWCDCIPYSNSAEINTIIVKDWVKAWCFDIVNYESDRSGRNVFSYKPTGLSNIDSTNFSLKVNEVMNFWRLLEPDQGNRYSLLDKYLFKILFKKIYEKDAYELSLEEFLDETLNNAGVSDSQLKSIILSPTDHNIILLSNKKIIENNQSNPLTIISRALLMLRLATGAAVHLLKSANISKIELDFYWSKLGRDLGYWKDGENTPDFVDLWTVVEDSVLEIQNWVDNYSSSFDLNSFYDQNFHQTNLCQLSRAALWGIDIN